jgi:hypothetical protein
MHGNGPCGRNEVERPVMQAANERLLVDPGHLHAVVADVRFAPLWLGPRLILGWLWLEAGWSRLQDTSALADLVAFGLILCGVALMLGVCTGPAAFVGGSLSIEIWAASGPAAAALLFAAVVWLMLAWKTAGWIGFDRWLLPLLGMPWHGGALFDSRSDERSGR